MTESLLIKNFNKILVLTVIVLVFLRFWGINNLSVQNDHALNSMRAVGWFDFLTGKGQTSPIVWFGQIPWWGNLSFHDHPPLVFFIQHIFFKVFGDFDLIAFLPYALASLLTAWLLYRLLKKQASNRAALWGLIFFTVWSYTTWISRTGYLEGVQILFITLAVYCFVSAIKELSWRWWIGLAASLAAALLSKYTALFLIPTFFVYLLIWQRAVFRNKKFWAAAGLVVILLTPIIIYNIEVFQARGHFDAALSSMVGMKPADYSVLSYRQINVNIFGNFLNFWQALVNTTSWPFGIFLISSFIYLFILLFRRRDDILARLSLFGISCLIIFFLFSQPAARFLAMSIPFFIFSLALMTVDLRTAVNRLTQNWQRQALWILFGLIIILELFYSINTNIFSRPVGSPVWAYSGYRFYNQGFNELDKFLRANVLSVLPPLRRVTSLNSENTTAQIRGQEVILVDERTDWFSRVWYVDRYIYYYQAPFIYFTDLANFLPPGQSDGFDYLRRGGATGFWLVMAANPEDTDNVNDDYGQVIDGLVSSLDQMGIKPVKEIKDYRGVVTMKIYHVQ